MIKIQSGFQLNGVSVSWGARLLAIAFATLLIGIGLQDFVVILIGALLMLLSFGLALSIKRIYLNKDLGILTMVYRNLFRKRIQIHQLSTGQFISFRHENHSAYRIDMVIISTNWYPVKNSSYFVTLEGKDTGSVILDECIDLKETVATCKRMSKALNIKFHSPIPLTSRS